MIRIAQNTILFALALAGFLALIIILARAAPAADNIGIDDECPYNSKLAYDDPACKPKPIVWRPWQQVWQCNDIRLTVTSRTEGLIEYDVAGSIWGGSQFAVDFRRRFAGSGTEAYYFNGRPCARLQ